jgi:uncharacterized protein
VPKEDGRNGGDGGWIERLGLQPHPEGGCFAETYRSGEVFQTPEGERAACTCIYFLLRAGERSMLHRIRSDELWHFYDGDPIDIHAIHPDGSYSCTRLSRHQPQAMVPAGSWFGAELAGSSGHALCGCTVSPGFDFEDFELAEREEMLRTFPRQRAIVLRLTPEGPR